MDRESKKVLLDKYDSNADTRESMHSSELSWLAHWGQSSQDPASYSNSNLQIHGLTTKQSTDGNRHRGANDVKTGNTLRDLTAVCASEDNVLQKKGEEVVEVLQSFLRPGETEISEHNRAKSMDKLCELVTGIPKAEGVPLPTKPLAMSAALGFLCSHSSDDPRKSSTSSYMQLPMSSFPVSHSRVGPLGTLSKSCDDVEKAIGFEDAPVESFSPQVNGVSFYSTSASQAKPWPLARGCSGRDGHVEDLVHPTQEMLRRLKNNFPFDSSFDRDQLTLSSDGPANGMLVPFLSSRSSSILLKCDEDLIRQGSFRETYEKHFTVTHSYLCESNHCNCGSSFTCHDNATKVNVVESADCGSDGTEKKFIHSLVTGFHSSTFTEGGRRFFRNSSVMEFSQGTNKHTSLAANFAETTAKDVEKSRFHTTVGKMEGDHGVHSMLSDTTHRFLITENTDITYCKEEQRTKMPLMSTTRDRNTLLGIVGSFSSFHDYDNASMMKPFNKVPKPDPLKERMHDYYYRSHGNAEVGQSSKQARVFSRKSTASNEIDADTGGSGASFERSPALLTLEETDTYKKTEKVAGVAHYPNEETNSAEVPSESTDTEQLDLDIILPRNNSVKDLSSGSNHKDRLESEISRESSQTMISTVKEAKSGILNKNDGAVNKREMCESRAQNSVQEGQSRHADVPGTSYSDFRWVKRLKLNDLEAVGTKRSITSDSTGESKRIMLFSKVLNYSRSYSNSDLQSNAGARTQQQHWQLVERVTLPRQKKSAPNLVRESKDILSNPWIRRWRCSQVHSMPMSSADMIFEPECMKMSIIEMQGKEFPSLGAMALMGKALTNFRKSELTRRGSLVVWKA